MGGGKGGFVGAVGNFSIQYNLASASIALAVMKKITELPEEPDWARYLLLSVVFVGCALGMVVMGRLGDTIGLSKAMQLTTGLSVLGAIVPACAFGPAPVFYGMIIFGRILLGIGVGGIYPLSAATAAESGDMDLEEKAKTTARAFFWQSPGAIVPYGCALFLDQYLERSVLFRVLFALGALPAAVVFFASCGQNDSTEFAQAQEDKDEATLCDVIRMQSPRARKTLLGTCLTWFFFDVAFYGTSVFVPNIIKSIFGDDESLKSLAEHSGLIAACVIPGNIASIACISCCGVRRLNIAGFVFQAVFFSLFAIAFYTEQSDDIKFALLGVLFFFLSFGPNVATYVAPVISFPADVRSTFHGISAMSGKLGAVGGALIFVPLQDVGGITSVLCLQCIIALLGVMSAFLLRDVPYETIFDSDDSVCEDDEQHELWELSSEVSDNGSD